MTSVNEYRDADETTDQERDLYPLDHEFEALPEQHRHLGFASQALDHLHALLKKKAGTNRFVRGDHPELGEVREEQTYFSLRDRFLYDLGLSGRPDLLGHAERVLPEALFPITTGRAAWNEVAVEIEELRGQLDQEQARVGLLPFRFIFVEYFRTIDKRVRFIIEQTDSTPAPRWPVIPDNWFPLPSTGNSWHDYLNRQSQVYVALAESQWRKERLAQSSSPSVAPKSVKPVGTDNPFSVVFDSMRESQISPLLLPEPETPKQKQRRAVIDPAFVQRLYWEMHDNPTDGGGERFPSAQEVSDRLPQEGHRYVNEKDLRAQMREFGPGWPPPCPPLDEESAEYSE